MGKDRLPELRVGSPAQGKPGWTQRLKRRGWGVWAGVNTLLAWWQGRMIAGYCVAPQKKGKNKRLEMGGKGRFT